ncbi:unnamed protein product [Lupinus luteus]|uniref:Leucine-rich repeat-containing N-terminal plant-type domain-containing protein n=1 Tax=Lupinus luteus TaxID=3873 RepID=A0AAV1XC47_LUPLU
MRRYISYVFVVLFLLAEICMCENSSKPCIQREREALIKFKASFHDPYNSLSSWKGNDFCQWEGITCDNVTSHVVKLGLRGFSLEAQNLDPSLLQLEYLSYLDLSGNYFNCTPIPIFIGSMKRLRYLSLSYTSFCGRIPNTIGNLTNLRHLDLSLNDDLNLNIKWISQLQSLEYLDISVVNLDHKTNLFQVLSMLPSLSTIYMDYCELGNMTIPSVNLTSTPQLQILSLRENVLTNQDFDALQNMTSLVHLDLSDNNLNLVPSRLSNFKKIEYLDLSDNVIRGPIHDVLKNMTSIQFLDLSSNYLTSVPCSFGGLKRLVHLALSMNDFTLMECSLSTILTNLCRLKALYFSYNKLGREPLGDTKLSGCITYDLEVLDLSNNEFSGHFPSWFGRLKNLNYLDLHSNFLYGSIPSSLGKMSKLETLYLSNNTLDGNLPNNIQQLTNLTTLDVSFNKFYGALPHSLGKLVKLRNLDLSNNYFNATIPQTLGKLVNLVDLDLSNNHLDGFIPQSFSQLTHLWRLNISTNKLLGNIPDDFYHLVDLSYLDLSSNRLDGMIPIMHGLSFMNLSYNHISGSLPKNIGNKMPNLQILLLGSNQINGSIPNSLCQIELYKLDLSKNKISGVIPNCWRNTESWEEINLSSNNLSGVFPTSFGNLSSLSWLHLNNNNLRGRLPMHISDLKKLLIFDLGENQFSGSIPLWATNTFHSLQILRLSKNKLSGSIPSQLCRLASLKILDLSGNNLVGSIPKCIGDLKGMTNGKSNNESLRLNFTFSGWSYEDVKQVMKGREFDYLKILEFVVNMDLSENKLVGFIPDGITSLIGLHGLNLSHNCLEGEIPKMIGDMKSLESFDISHNQLSGNIPNNMLSLTSMSHLNLSYNNFSGPIPQGYQFSTYDQYVYADNPNLCGPPLLKCPGDDSHDVSGRGFEEDEDGKEDRLEKLLLYSVIAVGFATGFWGIILVLVVKKSFRYACFRWVEDVTDMVYVEVVIKVARMKKWLVRNHVQVLFLLAEICMCENSSKPCIQREREALIKFKASFHDPYNSLSSWKGNDFCQWEGITCDNVTSHVVKLGLRGFSLEAQNLDPSLLQLEYLSYLDLSGNYFNCTPIPIFIGSMKRLRYLSLSYTSFCGRIPNTIGNLTNLRHLDLSLNDDLNLNIKWISQLQIGIP